MRVYTLLQIYVGRRSVLLLDFVLVKRKKT